MSPGNRWKGFVHERKGRKISKLVRNASIALHRLLTMRPRLSGLSKIRNV